MKLFFRYLIGLFSVLSALFVFTNIWIIGQTSDRVHEDLASLKQVEVGLVFGTSNKLVGGEPNPFFVNRMKAAASLVASGKVESLILSGSRDSIYYNEANKMQEHLMNMGVDASRLILDENGDRTLKSITRLRDVYGFDECIMITQQYHAYRCVFIADNLGVQAECYQAQTPEMFAHKGALTRELFARTKAILDIFLLYPSNNEK